MASDVTVQLEGQPTWSRYRSIGHYGGALDKENSSTEGRIPYAWVFYRELRGGRGSAYRTVYEGTKTGLVHAENVAMARSEAGRWRTANRLQNNCVPVTSDETLDTWLEILKVKIQPEDTIQDIRLRCATKYEAGIGPTARFVDDSVDRLLGDTFVRSWRLRGSDLATPPTPTYPIYTPMYDAGPAAYWLTTYAWVSSRAHYIVEVQQDPNMLLADFLTLVNVHLFDLLDPMLPAWATFNWATNIQDGFSLDVSDLDFDGFNP